MLRLYLLRHAKAEKAAGGQDDRDRRLTNKGRENAAALGWRFYDVGWLPERVISSTAVRARETAELWTAGIGFTDEIDYRVELYDAPASVYIDLLNNIAGAAPVLMIGHNPGIEELASRLVGRWLELKAGDTAVIDIDIPEWATLSPDAPATLVQLVRA